MNVLTPTLIGVTASLREEETHYCGCEYLTALTAQGALPVVLPVTEDEAMLRDYVQALDGFLFTGGGDVDPSLYGQWQRPACGSITPQRDAHELTLARLLLENGRKPVLGICRGIQVLNVALGGDIYQDLTADFRGTPFLHRQQQPCDEQQHHHTVFFHRSTSFRPPPTGRRKSPYSPMIILAFFRRFRHVFHVRFDVFRPICLEFGEFIW